MGNEHTDTHTLVSTSQMGSAQQARSSPCRPGGSPASDLPSQLWELARTPSDSRCRVVWQRPVAVIYRVELGNLRWEEGKIDLEKTRCFKTHTKKKENSDDLHAS